MLMPVIKRDVPGFYVVNPQTGIAVARYDDRLAAETDAGQRDARYPEDPVHLVVVEVAADDA